MKTSHHKALLAAEKRLIDARSGYVCALHKSELADAEGRRADERRKRAYKALRSAEDRHRAILIAEVF